MDKILALQKEIAEIMQTLAAKKLLLEEYLAALAKQPTIDSNSSSEAKITLFRSLFRGREDVYAERYENKKTGMQGYKPACKNEWVRGICEKGDKSKKIKCSNCAKRLLKPITNEVIKDHLMGDIVMGVYPMLLNETCCFLAVDFDKATWQEDAKAYMNTCKLEGIPAAMERSRSGNGAHIWIFFDKPVLVSKARKLGAFLMTRTLDRRPEIEKLQEIKAIAFF
jgi:hypothetical protein